MTLALSDSMVSHAISRDCKAVVLAVRQISLCSTSCYHHTYPAPTGILTGPLDDKSNKLTQPTAVLMKLEEITVSPVI
jgi:hypothetical protein